MDRGPTSDNLLAHFDRPKLLDMPDFEWVDEVIPLEPASGASQAVSAPNSAERFIEVPRDTRRGVCWVLAWAGALMVFAIATGVLAEFGYVLAAESALSAAARAGAREATLPRATYQSVTAAVDRRLNHYPLLAKQLRLSLLQNGTLVQSQFRQHDGDLFTITLSGPSNSAVPDWLRTLMFWHSKLEIQAHAELQLPGRNLGWHALTR
jgi:hypothetical protein